MSVPFESSPSTKSIPIVDKSTVCIWVGVMEVLKGDDNETYQISKIAGRKATVIAPDSTGSNALSGTSLAWTFTASGSDGAAQIEEAGDDDTKAGTDDDDFSNA